MVSDGRPLHSPMPADGAAIWQELVDRLKPMLDQAYDRVAALPGNPAGRQNDALSGLATVGSFVVQQLTARLMMRGVNLDDAFPVAMTEVHQRAAALLALMRRTGPLN